MATWFIDNLINPVISGLAGLINLILSVLPNSPIASVDFTPVTDILSSVNWFFPVGLCLDTISLSLVAIAIYYAWSTAARWGKLLE